MTYNPSRTVENGGRQGTAKVNWRIWLILITVLGLAVRAVVFVGFGNSFRSRGSSSGEYDAIAKHVLQGRGFTLDGRYPSIYTFPGYIYFLAAVYATVGDSPLAVSTIHTLLTALTGVLVFIIGWKVVDVRVGLLACLITNLLPWLALMTVSLTDGALFAVLTSASFLLACMMLQSSRWLWVVLGGMITGLAILVRGPVEVLAPLVVIWLFWKEGARQWKRPAVYVVLIGAVLSPWMVRNWRVCGRYISLSVAPNYALSEGNNPQIAAFISESKTFDMMPERYQPLSRSPQDILQASLLSRAAAIQFIRAHPWETVRLTIRKFFLFYSWSYWPHKIAGPNGSVEDAPYLRLHSLIYAWSIRPLFILALVGAIIGCSKHRELLLLTAFLVLLGLGHALVAVFPRYRVPFDPLLAVLAAYGVIWIWDRHVKSLFAGDVRLASGSSGLERTQQFEPPAVPQDKGERT